MVRYNDLDYITSNSQKWELIEEDVFNFIKKTDTVSLAELFRHFENTKGEIYFAPKLYPNIYYLLGMSKELSDILGNLLDKKQIYIKPTAPFTYLLDGVMFHLPIAKKAKSYKTPHWLPTIIRSIDKLQTEDKKFQKLNFELYPQNNTQEKEAGK